MSQIEVLKNLHLFAAKKIKIKLFWIKNVSVTKNKVVRHCCVLFLDFPGQPSL